MDFAGQLTRQDRTVAFAAGSAGVGHRLGMEPDASVVAAADHRLSVRAKAWWSQWEHRPWMTAGDLVWWAIIIMVFAGPVTISWAMGK